MPRSVPMPPTQPQPPLRVGILVDLELGPEAGGHVKCWQRLAAAAPEFAGELDLTVHFVGAEPRVETKADNVRYVIERPVFSTSRLTFLPPSVPAHTDLARRHGRLARWLPSYDLIHTTDAYFAYARTAVAVARRRRIPLTTSVHTNTPRLARFFTDLTVERLFGNSLAGRLVRSADFGAVVERRMQRRLQRHLRACAFAFIGQPAALPQALRATNGRATLLRRGVEHDLFTPEKRDRAWLQRQFGIAPGRFVIMFAGRVAQSKNVGMLADAVASLAARGVPVHLVCAGAGEDRTAICRRLGDIATCPGNLADDVLARVYASSDVFAFPSQIEEHPNVVLESLSAGLPCLVADEGGMSHVVRDGETGFILPGEGAKGWARTIAALAADPARRTGMSAAARDHALRRIPSWGQVLGEDLLPRWREAADRDVVRAAPAFARGVAMPEMAGQFRQ